MSTFPTHRAPAISNPLRICSPEPWDRSSVDSFCSSVSTAAGPSAEEGGGIGLHSFETCLSHLLLGGLVQGFNLLDPPPSSVKWEYW